MKVDIIYIIVPFTLLFVMYIAFYQKPKQEKIVVREVIDPTPAPYYTFAYPNYWERYPRDNTYYNAFYDPYLSYPYAIGPWWYGYGYSSGGGGSGYSGGIRTGGGGRHGGGSHGGGHSGGHGGGGKH